MGNIFAWILLIFPVYLLVNGKLGSYLALASGGVMTTPPAQAAVGQGPAYGGLNPEVPGIGFPGFGQPGTGFLP